MKKTRDMIWEMYSSECMQKTDAELDKAMKNANDSKNDLYYTLSFEQQEMLIKCHDKWDKVVAVSEKTAFLDGVKFAMNFVMEACDNK